MFQSNIYFALPAFKITVICLDVFFAGVFALHWFKHRQRVFIAFLVSTLFYILCDALQLAVVLQVKKQVLQGKTHPDHSRLPLVMTAFTAGVIAALTVNLVVVRLLAAWAHSLEGAPAPGEAKCRTARSITTWLWWLYAVLAVGAVASMALTLWVSWEVAILGGVLAWFDTMLNIVQFALCVWLWLAVRKTEGEAYAAKRRQMVILLFLTGFMPTEMFPANMIYRKPFAMFIFMAVAAWPGSLLGFEEKPVDGGIGAMPGSKGMEEAADADAKKLEGL